MDLSVRDLILKPETAGPGILTPSAQGAGDAVSLAAFNDLLGRLGQGQRSAADRLPERELSPAPADAYRPARAEDHQPRVSPSRQQDTETRPSTDDTRPAQAEASDQAGAADPKARPETPAPNPENDAPDTAPSDTPANEAAANAANTASGQPVSVSSGTLGAIASAAVTAAHAIQGGTAQTAPGQAVATAVASAVASAAPGQASQSASSPANLPQTAKALGLKPAVGTAGATEAPEGEGLPLNDLGAAKKNIAAAQPAGAVTAKGTLPAAASESMAQANVPAEITVEKGPAFAQTRPAQAPGIFIAQEVADTNAAVSRFQIGGGETGSVANPGAGTPSGGAPATPQMAATQSGADTLPSAATATAVDATLSRPTGATTAPPTSASAVIGVGPGATASTASGTSPAATAAMRAPQSLPVPVDQFAVHVARAAAGGADHISIKLKPASLGQVEVKLEVTHDGRIAAVVTAERPETLDMLQRDARALERALQEAGLKTDANSLQFNLRGENGFGSGSDGMNTPGAAAESADAGPVLEAAAELVAGIYQNSRASIGGVDIRV